MTLLAKRHLFTPKLFLSVVYVSLAAVNFGIDVSLFGSVQGMQSFTREFGKYNEATQSYRLTSPVQSAANAVPFLAKLLGTLICGPLMERYGRKSAMLAIGVVSLVGVTLQIASYSMAQYILGRCLCYTATGFTIAAVPAYEAEVAPAELRGGIGATVQFWLNIGQFIGSGVTYGTSDIPSRAAWQIPTGIQYIMPAIILAGLPFIPESPRWLLSTGRRQRAIDSMRKFRPSSVSLEEVESEVDLLSDARTNQGKGTWAELFKGTNKRRTLIAVGAMFFQQITGQSFSSQYAVVFYQQQNITNPSPFLLGWIGNICGVVAVIIATFTCDLVGRRLLLITGSSLMALWLYVVAGVGSIENPTYTQSRVLIAAFLLFPLTYSISYAPLAYVTMAESPSGRLREKTACLATSISVITTFLVSFTLPYLLNAPYAHLGPKVGYIYGTMCVVAVIFTIFVVPELRGLSLEQSDELFARRASVWDFSKASVRNTLTSSQFSMDTSEVQTSAPPDSKQGEVYSEQVEYSFRKANK